MTFRRALTALIGPGAWLLIVPATALAQQPPDAGSTLRQLEQPELELPAEPPPEVELEQPERPVLEPGAAFRFTLRTFRITGSSAFSESELLSLVADLVGREVGFVELDEAAARITRFYRSHGYPVARAYLPQQQIRDGAVEIAVLEGRFGRLRLDNESRIDDGRVRAHLDDVVSGAPVQGLKLDRGLLLIADLEGAGVPRAVLQPGAEVGQTDLALRLEPEPMFRGSIGYDNGGNTFTGRDRVRADVDILSPFGWGDVLSIEGLKEFPGTDFASIRYEIPIGGDGLRLNGGYSHLEYDLGKDFAALDASGDADTWRAGVGYPLLRSREFNFYTTLDFEYTDLHDRIDATATVTDRYYFFLSGGVSGDFRDDLFGGGLNLFSLHWTAGELEIETPEADVIDDATLRTDEVFQRWNLQFLRLQRLTDSLSLYLSLTTQKADGNLDSSQKLVVGGPFGVRAFEPGEASGDSGYVFTGELRHDFDLPSLPGAMQVAGFIDRAHITINEDPFPRGIDNHRNLRAVGASLTWEESGNFFVKGTFAHRIGGGESRSDPGDDAQFWLEAVKYF